MRRLLEQDFLFPAIVLCFSLVLSQGCTRTVLQTYPASSDEIATVKEAFARFRQFGREQCSCCLDAEVDVTVSISGWISDHTGKFSGYLQAMQPGYMKFVAINPLGQPLYIFTTDGRIFTGLNVHTEKAYLGSVQSQTYMKFAPLGFEPEFSYYWLTGRLPPGDTRIVAVTRNREPGKFWLRIHRVPATTDSMILFDPANLLILRHVMLDERGERLVDIRYDDYQSMAAAADIYGNVAPANLAAGNGAATSCKVPATISIASREDAGEIGLRLYAFLKEPHLAAEDFAVHIPENFEQLLVK